MSPVLCAILMPLSSLTAILSTTAALSNLSAARPTPLELTEEFPMEIIVLQVFVSLMLVVGSLLLFAYSAKQRDLEHSDRLALMPLEQDIEVSASVSPPRGARGQSRSAPHPKARRAPGRTSSDGRNHGRYTRPTQAGPKRSSTTTPPSAVHHRVGRVGARGATRRRHHRPPARILEGQRPRVPLLRPSAPSPHQRRDIRFRRQHASSRAIYYSTQRLVKARMLGVPHAIPLLGMASHHRRRRADPSPGFHPGQGVRGARVAHRHRHRRHLGRLRHQLLLDA